MSGACPPVRGSARPYICRLNFSHRRYRDALGAGTPASRQRRTVSRCAAAIAPNASGRADSNSSATVSRIAERRAPCAGRSRPTPARQRSSFASCRAVGGLGAGAVVGSPARSQPASHRRRSARCVSSTGAALASPAARPAAPDAASSERWVRRRLIRQAGAEIRKSPATSVGSSFSVIAVQTAPASPGGANGRPDVCLARARSPPRLMVGRAHTSPVA